jgi:hypothetical protein
MSLSTIPLLPNVMLFPAVQGSLVFSQELRSVVAELNPDCIAVEFPAVFSEELDDLVSSLPEIRLLAWRTAPGAAYRLVCDPADARIEALRLARELEVAHYCVDSWQAGIEEPFPQLPDPAFTEATSWPEYIARCAASIPVPAATPRDRLIAARLHALSRIHQSVLFVGSFRQCQLMGSLLAAPANLPPRQEEVPELEVQSVGLTPRQLGLVLLEIPFVLHQFELHRGEQETRSGAILEGALDLLLRSAAATYLKEYDQEVSLTEWHALRQFARNLSVLRSHCRPHIYELVTAAKGCVDGDFGAIVLQQAEHYPPNDSSAEFLPMAYSAEDEEGDDQVARHGSLDLYASFDEDTERLQPAYAHPELAEIFFRFNRRPRPTVAQKEEWQRDFESGFTGICSWPPEDFFIEKLFRDLRTKALHQLSDGQSSSEEFTSSVLDGLDVRETMRHFHQGKLYVQRKRNLPGKVGPVVLIWRDLPLPGDDVWRAVLYAENSNESDIVVYTTPMGEEMVGPGITRIEYHGILSIYPARGLGELWEDRRLIHRIRQLVPGELTHARLLIAFSIIVSQEKYIAVVSPTPPDNALRDFARRVGRELLHIPAGSIGKDRLKRARQCHILRGHAAREWAGDYIPDL